MDLTHVMLVAWTLGTIPLELFTRKFICGFYVAAHQKEHAVHSSLQQAIYPSNQSLLIRK